MYIGTFLWTHICIYMIVYNVLVCVLDYGSISRSASYTIMDVRVGLVLQVRFHNSVYISTLVHACTAHWVIVLHVHLGLEGCS